MRRRIYIVILSFVAVVIGVVIFSMFWREKNNKTETLIKDIFENHTSGEAAERGENASQFLYGYASWLDEVEKSPALEGYMSVSYGIKSENIGEFMEKLEVYEKDIKVVYEVYEIKGISSEFAVAVKPEGISQYIEFANWEYEPSDLKGFIKDTGLSNTYNTFMELTLKDKNKENKLKYYSDDVSKNKEFNEILFGKNYNYLGRTGDYHDSENVIFRCKVSSLTDDEFVISFLNDGSTMVIMDRNTCNSYKFEYSTERLSKVINYVADNYENIL